MRNSSGGRRLGALTAGGLAVLLLLLAVVGCDSSRSGARRPAFRQTRGEVGTPSPASGTMYDLDAIRDGSKLQLPDDDPASVFSKGGMTGGLSSQARSLENSLGVGP